MRISIFTKHIPLTHTHEGGATANTLQHTATHCNTPQNTNLSRTHTQAAQPPAPPVGWEGEWVSVGETAAAQAARRALFVRAVQLYRQLVEQPNYDKDAVWLWQVLCVAVCCSVLQCVAVCCSVLQCVAVQLYRQLVEQSKYDKDAVWLWQVLCVAVCCCVLQCVAVCCSVLQCA